MQLARAVVDDQLVHHAEHVHAEHDRRLARQAPVLPDLHVADGDGGAAHAHAVHHHRRQAHAVAALDVERDADDLRVGGFLQAALEGLEQRRVGERIGRAGVDDRLGAHAPDHHVDRRQAVAQEADRQVTKPARRAVPGASA